VGATALSKMTLDMKALCNTTLSITYENTTISIVAERFHCYLECRYAECHYAECRYAECHYAVCRYAECRYAQCHYAEC